MPTLRYYGAQEEDGRGVPEAAPSVLSSPPPVRFPTGVVEPLPPPAVVPASVVVAACVVVAAVIVVVVIADPS